MDNNSCLKWNKSTIYFSLQQEHKVHMCLYLESTHIIDFSLVKTSSTSILHKSNQDELLGAFWCKVLAYNNM